MRPDAVADILDNARFQGAISSIQPVTSFIDHYFIMFISVVAFFIIAAAMARNVIAGAYAAFPRFFDMISEAKATIREKQLNVGGVDVGIVLRIIAFVIPDFKSLSDFHDNNVEPKHYFVRAIPQMFAVVMIGIVIYNGYYRDSVSFVGKFGSEMLNRFFTNTDPVAIYERIFQAAGRPKFSTEDDSSTLGEYTTKISKDIYGKIITSYTDINSTSARSELAVSIESWVSSQLGTVPIDQFDKDAYKIKYSVERVLGDPDLTNVSRGDTDNTTTYGFKQPCTGFKFESTQDAYKENWYIRVVIRFTKQTAKTTNNKSTGVTACTMNIGKSSVVKGSNTIEVSLGSSATQYLVSGGAGGFTVNNCKATLDSSGTIKITGISEESMHEFENSSTWTVKSLNYQATNEKGTFKSIAITSFDVSSSGSGCKGFSGNGATWNLGEVPENKAAEEDKDNKDKKADSNQETDDEN